MKVPFAALGLLLISAAQALPLPKTDKTAPISKTVHKRAVYGLWNGFPHIGKSDDVLLGLMFDLGRKVQPHPKMQAHRCTAVSHWHDKENDRFESNSWALSPHELRIFDEIVKQDNQPATVGKPVHIV
ncbi:uncharacterized protein NECHADRAFT_122552 [Fusarium vanettenii 77-13-4]|uniref:Uncharacterized protein n=1 Tax=Fusarium vanettenii (strain ATCC MYA-4622 / CBS 123669 / FGSC 9596 / NRRL 45880 / 77-13-4) TaxID=660122 RepID=C7Z0K3_FUSV7|nr:uncharacterized protein NECHADRAFT_122552 [Fusarium vanettenii 77-13-4]EEU42395.1 predicted protein [Fusarium vanettenii 77-13-4]